MMIRKDETAMKDGAKMQRKKSSKVRKSTKRS